MPEVGVEPTCLSTLDFESSSYAYSDIQADRPREAANSPKAAVSAVNSFVSGVAISEPPREYHNAYGTPQFFLRSGKTCRPLSRPGTGPGHPPSLLLGVLRAHNVVVYCISKLEDSAENFNIPTLPY